jgi:hypothetical protein
MRDVARRFNARFGEDLLVVPDHRIPAAGRGSWTCRSRPGRCRPRAARWRGPCTSSTSRRRSRRRSSAR